MTKPSMPQEHANNEKMPTSIADIITQEKAKLNTEGSLSEAQKSYLAKIGDVSIFGVDALHDKLASKGLIKPCSLGMGCEDAGVCYAAAMNCPERCGKE